MQFRLHVDVSKIVTTVVLLILGGVLSACTVLGTGRSTLVLADPPPGCKYGGLEFKHLIAAPGKARLIGLQGEKPHTNDQWETFKSRRLGGTDVNVASIDINVRNQSNTPPLELFNIETASAADVTKILTDSSIDFEQKSERLGQLRNNYRRLPETYTSLVSHGIDEKGKDLYYYFPRVTIDLTSTLNTAETLDRFDYIAVAIRIREATNAIFINFSPKAADLFEFTLGQIKQSAAAKASASMSNKVTTNATTGNNSTGAAGTSTSVGGELGYGGSVDFTLTEELTRDIKSSLESRSAGIMKNGKLFLVELRGNEQKRIAGTFSFNVMLQIPSNAVKGYLNNGKVAWTESTPKVQRIDAEVRIVGIVRHVVKPGKTGFFEQMPEPLNDETFRQVVLHDQEVPLWEFTDIPDGHVIRNLTVHSNIDGASFIVVDETDGRTLFHGTGREVHLPVDAKNKVKIVFSPVIVGGDKPVVLKAPDITGITLTPDMNKIVVGNYMPISTPTHKPTP